ncbi:hypothetical protein F5X99DRAFT_374043 [Biscogniauxia marginata]|nr:hypothetical protein F5X99DRAFT_374043 [Biscogniauxia marginata]
MLIAELYYTTQPLPTRSYPAMVSKHAWKVELIPWDHSSPEHVERMYDQRVACGWRSDEVPSWVESAKSGGKIFYWIIFSDTLTDRGELEQKHAVAYPKESTPLRDTASEVRLVSRQPTGREFIPIGHVALDIHDAEEDTKLGLPSPGTVWVHQLYISYALQGGGYGTGAMSKVEALAAQEPMNATVLALDTMAKGMDLSPEHAEVLEKELKSPISKISKEEWYERQEYKTYKRGAGYVYRSQMGHQIPLTVAYMKKMII